MSKNNIKTEIKILGIMIIGVGLCLLLLQIYSIYLIEAIENLSDIYYLIFGLLLLVAGLGLIKYKSWARKIMLYTMTAHLLFGILHLFDLIRLYISLSEIDCINTDYHQSIYCIFGIAITFVFMFVIPTVGTLFFLNRKEIKELFKKEKLITI
jgi:uncharacterized membrane protein